MPKPSSWLMIAWLTIPCLGAAAAGCHKAPAAETARVAAAPEAVAEPPSDPPPAVRLAIQLVASRTPIRPAPSAPRVVEPSHDLYDDPRYAQSAPVAPAPAEASGFRLTVPLCRRAEREGDPLAKTPECMQLIEAAKAQAKACRQAFEAGDDKAALSPACRQAAGFR